MLFSSRGEAVGEVNRIEEESEGGCSAGKFSGC